jgi:two-component system CheB/CheR fusion protein
LGLGLGLSIVHRIGDLLGLRIDVRSELGRGSVFSVEVPLSDNKDKKRNMAQPQRVRNAPHDAAQDASTILIVEDDPAIRTALELLFKKEGYSSIAVGDGAEIAALSEGPTLNFDLIVADYNLPGGRTGLEVIADLRKTLGRRVPAIVLTGDISTDVQRKVIAGNCEHLHKPVNVDRSSHSAGATIAGHRES